MLPSAAADIVHNLLNELKTMLTSLAKHMSHEIKELVNLTFKRFSKYSQEDLEELQNENIVQKCQDDLWLCCQYIKLLVETNTFQSTQIFSGPNDNMLYESTVKTQDPSRVCYQNLMQCSLLLSSSLSLSCVCVCTYFVPLLTVLCNYILGSCCWCFENC